MSQNRPQAPPESPAWLAALSSDLPVTARQPRAGIHLRSPLGRSLSLTRSISAFPTSRILTGLFQELHFRCCSLHFYSFIIIIIN